MRDFWIRTKIVGVLFVSAVIIEIVIDCLELVHYSVRWLTKLLTDPVNFFAGNNDKMTQVSTLLKFHEP